MTKKLDSHWWTICFDHNWCSCDACKSWFWLEDVKRKNKCPHCKTDNRLCGGKQGATTFEFYPYKPKNPIAGVDLGITS
jgi:hypothetical protein